MGTLSLRGGPSQLRSFIWAMALIFVSAAVALADNAGVVNSAQPASQTSSLPPTSPHQLRQSVRQAMRAEAVASGEEHASAVRRLVEVFEQLKSDTSLPERERLQMLHTLRNRLRRTSEALQRDLAKGEKGAKEPRLPDAEQGVLAQRLPAAGIGGGRAQRTPSQQSAQALIDLIQTTIAPATWEANGGLGTIMYFEPKGVLVIRQTGGVHEQVGEAIGQLRK